MTIALESTSENDVGIPNCMQSLQDDFTGNLFVNKPVVKSYIIVKHRYYDNVNLEKDFHVNFFGEDCVECFVNEILEIDTFMKQYFENEIERNPNTIGDYDETKYRLCEKDFKSTKRCSKFKKLGTHT